MAQPTLFAFGFKKPAPDDERSAGKDKSTTKENNNNSKLATPIRTYEKANNRSKSASSDRSRASASASALSQDVNGSNKVDKDSSFNISKLNLSTPSKDCDKGKGEVSKGNASINESSEEMECDDDDSDSPILKPTTSKRRLRNQRQTPKRARVESESEDEYTPEDDKCSDESVSDAVASEEMSSESVSEIEEHSDEDEKPKSKKKKVTATPKESSSKTSKPVRANLSDSVIAKLSAFTAPKNDNNEGGAPGIAVARDWPHSKFEFLQPDKIMDKQRRRPDHPDYDPKTIFVPESFRKKQTPAHGQWWLFKQDHFDTIFFFKMGKFYEMFHMDAVIGVQELNLLFMRGEHAHAGFPEKCYKKYSDILLKKGYKIARIEQTETPEQRDERCKHQKTVDKVVSRELCRITTPATRTSSVLDAEPSSPHSTYLLAISEPYGDNQNKDNPIFGVCFIETSIGKFHIGQFVDNRYCSKLRTLLTCYPASEILLERGKVTPILNQALKFCSATKVMLKTGKEFWDASKVMKSVQETYYSDEIPKILLKMTDPTDALHEKPKEEFKYALRAFGAVVYYLKECLIDEELLTMRFFEHYEPDKDKNGLDERKALTVDSISLKNLEIFENSAGTSEATLYETMDFCSTKFGKRLLRSWLCAPLCSIELINERLDALEDLRKSSVKKDLEEICDLLHKIPDLERLLSKIHTQGCLRRSKSHPDARAVLFDNNIYSKRKIMDFLSVLEGFKRCLEVRKALEKLADSFESKLLRKCVQLAPKGYFPDVTDVLNEFDHSFDHSMAYKEGKIVPNKGIDKDHDSAVREIKDVERQLEEYRSKMSGKLGTKVSYAHAGKNRYQLEIPDAVAKKCGDEFNWIGSRKGFRRFHTDKIKSMLSELTSAEDKKEASLKDIMRKIFESFDSHFTNWSAIVKCIGIIDCMISLSKFCDHLVRYGDQVCRPFIEKGDNSRPFIKIEQGKHPCLLKNCVNFVANDLELNNELLLLTGPNMGGKSTLMRQTGLIVMLAQIGCFVPAKSCHLSPIDAIFTRLGAYDQIMEGRSTFFAELSETSLIIQNATGNSLVLLDELGRGTSTYDGTAIASAVIDHLITQVNCRTLFSTHYHSLTEQFSSCERVKLAHMACMVENENEDDPSSESIVFLYQLVSGSCPKSHGFNAAKLAGIDLDLIRKAHEKAKEFELFSLANRAIQKLMSPKTQACELRNLISNLISLQVN
ncbi:DNA mismatch repair protein Msh6 [Brevipalpus obovatus]|uniref:DNA mismatch repair protein Msh6 n=1 Tax=Brevipalpus obovatus TaxID=246614 RepID=UPI003D9F915E